MHKLFAGTLLLSAALLFCVQPMIARMVLPLLGGSPAVWNTCMVFFQAALLLGYLYAHALNWLDLRWQVMTHIALLSLPFFVLPFALSETSGWQMIGAPQDTDPVWWQLQLLVVVVGLPFLVVASTAPLLQRWFAATRDPSAGDPYFLYAASNVGSMAALLGYPLLLEPLMKVSDQSGMWTVGYGVLALLIGLCGVTAWRSAIPPVSEEVPPDNEQPTPDEPTRPTEDRPVTLARRLHWIVLAFVPSALMLAVTTYITSELASFPLLWVIPLAIYLLSFILVFAQTVLIPPTWMHVALPYLTLTVVFTFVTNVSLRYWQLIPMHWGVLFVAAMSCHARLAKDRPSPRHLTEFYLWLSVGGVLGGMFSALAAPMLFDSGTLEYPLLLILACLLLPGPSLWKSSSLDRWLDLLAPLGVAALGLVMVLVVHNAHEQPGIVPVTIILAVLTFICFFFIERPARFALSVAAMLLVVSASTFSGFRTLQSSRNFFGLLRVYDDPSDSFRVLGHGSTTHGTQKLTKEGKPQPHAEPSSYFTRSGPVGQMFAMFDARHGNRSTRIGVTGLGAGALASYAQPNEEWDYYEIDPAIVEVAEKSQLFTYIPEAKERARSLNIILGDARLRMREAPDAHYDLIVQDAFSSDSVPSHLLTREALELYLAKLKPDGLIMFNISNRYADFRPVLANLAASADPPLVCYDCVDVIRSSDQREDGATSSHWLVIARRAEDLGSLARDGRWVRREGTPGARVWTDDFSNLFSVLRWW